MPQSSRLDSILEGAEEEILEDVRLQDHLERFLSPRGQLEAKCVDLCRRVEDDAGVNPLRVRNTARTSPAQGLQILIAFLQEGLRGDRTYYGVLHRDLVPI